MDQNVDLSHKVEGGFAFDSLESIQRRLLDLSGRNRLLNFRYGKNGNLRFIENSLNNIYQRLIEGEKILLTSIKKPTKEELIESEQEYYRKNEKGEWVQLREPTATEWAREIGVSTNYNLPIDGKAEGVLLTPLFEDSLHARAEYLKREQNSIQAETGISVLYLALGFLEYTESSHSEEKRIAPIHTIPVELIRERQRGHRRITNYKIALSDEPIQENFTLQEKLQRDFGFALPVLEEGEDLSHYFAELTRLLENVHKEWRILPHISLITLNFAKQVMYRDLDPNNWPEGKELSKHPIIKQFFSEKGEEIGTDKVISPLEYKIDEIDEIYEKYPLVYNADSSQHSAIIDALRGKNLIIEGPPGTGKSQTITNLIAAAIYTGKRILFVAEKMAALKVVYNRLEQVGLSSYCLQLHSDKANKRHILDDLMETYSNRGKGEEDQLEEQIILREDAGKNLQYYADLINSKWRNTGLTIHTLFNRAVRYRVEAGELFEELSDQCLLTEKFNGDSFTLNEQLKFEQRLERLLGIYTQIARQSPNGKICEHPWYGAGLLDVTSQEERIIIPLLEEWNQKIDKILSLDDFSREKSIEKIKEEYDLLRVLPKIENEDFYLLTSEVVSDTDGFIEYCDQYKLIHQIQDQLSQFYTPQFLESDEKSANLKLYRSSIIALQPDPSKSINRYIELWQRADNLAVYIEKIEEDILQWTSYFPSQVSQKFVLNRKQIRFIQLYVEAIELLPASLWKYRNERYLQNRIDPTINLLRDYFNQIQPIRKNLDTLFDLALRPSYKEIRAASEVIKSTRFLGKLSKEYRVAKQIVQELAATQLVKFKDLKLYLDQYLIYLEKTLELERVGEQYPLFKDLYQYERTDFEAIFALREWGKTIIHLFGDGYDDAGLLGKSLMAIDEESATEIVAQYHQSYYQLLERLVLFYDESRLLILEPDYRFRDETPLLGDDSVLNKLVEYLRNTLEDTHLLLKETGITIGDLSDHIALIDELEQCINSWESHPWHKALESFAYRPNIEAGNYSQYFIEESDKTIEVSNAAQAIKPFMEVIQKKSYQSYLAFLDHCNSLEPLFAEEAKAAERFFLELQSEFSLWVKTHSVSFEDLYRRNQYALTNTLMIYDWSGYVKEKESLKRDGFTAIIEALDYNRLTIQQAISAILALIYRDIANETLQENEELAQFNGLTHNELVNSFRELDKRVIEEQSKAMKKLSRGKVPKGISSGRVSNYTEYSLLAHEASKKTRHIPIRDLLSRAKKSVSILKPCFMMSPISVAQYLKPGEFHFDLVVMDEASQILPEDALGAIARGSNLIVVGDPKQLPPTTFFQTHNQLDDEEDYHSIEESESILDVVRPIFVNRQLRWHYRSQHESLIAFSNHYFYDSNLVLFPSPMEETDELGVKYDPVSGVFQSGTNPIEAKRVADLLIDQITHHPDESVGVVAMNSKQQQLISDYVDKLKEELPNKIKLRIEDDSGLESVFIKNLESVQGDERDVIIISMTYGPERVGGRVMQRFGPINSSMGWRRLNVLFTRAKKRMLVVSSMHSSDILIDDNKSRGVNALRNFLHYCENGHFHTPNQETNREADSDFEVAVSHLIEEYGFKTVAQVGVAGYFIDLAVYHPNKPHHYLMGIECDGATYHSAKSVRDRDRLRQEVLESLGWNIRRIWSTDWFKNPRAVIKPIINELHQLAEQVLAENNISTITKSEIDFPDKVREENSIVEIKECDNIHIPIEWKGDELPKSFDEYLGDRLHENVWEGLTYFKDYLDLLYPEVIKGAHLLNIKRFEYFSQEMPVAMDEVDDDMLERVAPLHEAHYDELFSLLEKYAYI